MDVVQEKMDAILGGNFKHRIYVVWGKKGAAPSRGLPCGGDGATNFLRRDIKFKLLSSFLFRL